MQTKKKPARSRRRENLAGRSVSIKRYQARVLAFTISCTNTFVPKMHTFFQPFTHFPNPNPPQIPLHLTCSSQQSCCFVELPSAERKLSAYAVELAEEDSSGSSSSCCRRAYSSFFLLSEQRPLKEEKAKESGWEEEEGRCLGEIGGESREEKRRHAQRQEQGPWEGRSQRQETRTLVLLGG